MARHKRQQKCANAGQVIEHYQEECEQPIQRFVRHNLQGWRSITDEKEKYNAYLCSREWAVLKEAVHKRAGEVCERCKLFPIAAVHHLTYERKYLERPEDLAGWCEHCHAFTHGKAEFDPALLSKQAAKYLSLCLEKGLTPLPSFVRFVGDLPYWCRLIVVAIKALGNLAQLSSDQPEQRGRDAIIDAHNRLVASLPFSYGGACFEMLELWDIDDSADPQYGYAIKVLGLRDLSEKELSAIGVVFE